MVISEFEPRYAVFRLRNFLWQDKQFFSCGPATDTESVLPCDEKEMVLFVDKANVAYPPQKVESSFMKVESSYIKLCIHQRTANLLTDLKPRLKRKHQLRYISLREGNIA